jgi:uncharacterized membrane protein
MNQYKLNRFAVMTRLEVTGLMNIEGLKDKSTNIAQEAKGSTPGDYQN